MRARNWRAYRIPVAFFAVGFGLAAVAAERAEAAMRDQAERVGAMVRADGDHGTATFVANESGRPIRDMTCQIRSRVDDAALAEVAGYSGSYIPSAPSGPDKMRGVGGISLLQDVARDDAHRHRAG